MRVLVIGGTSFIGYALTWRLLAAGHKVTLFNRGQRPDPFGTRVERIVGDRLGPDLSRLEGLRFDAVIDMIAFRRAEVEAVYQLLNGNIGHYLLISTGQVYLVRDRVPAPAKEEDYDGPLMEAPSHADDLEEWSYGVEKRGCEDFLAEKWEQEKFPATRLRIPMIHGERDPQHRLETYLWRLLDGGPLLLPDNGHQIVRHAYADDVARAVVKLLGKGIAFGRAINFCQEESTTLSEFLGGLCACLGVSEHFVYVPRARLVEAGLTVRDLSPLSGRWVSHLDPSMGREEMGLFHDPYKAYLARIASSFLATLPKAPPPNYQQRPRELAFFERL